jgi:hypothetical protein
MFDLGSSHCRPQTSPIALSRALAKWGKEKFLPRDAADQQLSIITAARRQSLCSRAAFFALCALSGRSQARLAFDPSAQPPVRDRRSRSASWPRSMAQEPSRRRWRTCLPCGCRRTARQTPRVGISVAVVVKRDCGRTHCAAGQVEFAAAGRVGDLQIRKSTVRVSEFQCPSAGT